MERFLLAAAMAVSCTLGAYADLFAPDRPLVVMETEYFSFIFTEESRPAVEYLATFADDEYLEIAAMLGTSPRHRISVVMTPDAESVNGYTSAYPYVRIVLYQAPADPGSWYGSFKDDLRSLFRHELTHAVSLSIRSVPEDAAVAIFGSPLGLSSYLAPKYMVEGVTVSFESLDGFGRANDPLSAAVLRQDILEGRWKGSEQSGGAWDRYPGASLYYLYGGYFSRYLQNRYGMPRYAALWRRFGAASLFQPLDDFLFIKGSFSDIYGTSLSDEWDAFRESMTPRTPVYMAAELLGPTSSVAALAASGSTLFHHDAALETVFSYDTDTGVERPLFRAGSPVSRIDAAPDGSALLVSTIRWEAGLPRLALKVWDAQTGSLSDLPLAGLRDAAWYAWGSASEGGRQLVGIMVDGYETDIVTGNGDGLRVLLRGTERISYASPVSTADGGTVFAIAREDGVSSVVRISITGKSVAAVERLALPARLTWIRYLSRGSDGVIRFSWDDDSFYRLVELENDAIRYQTVPVSGGVHKPVSAGGRVYHLGNFSSGVAVCAFPSDRSVLGFEESPVRWEDASVLVSAESVYDAEPVLEAAPYNALAWTAPRFWLPTASIDRDGIVTAGAIVFVEDPVERLAASMSADWNFRADAVDLELSATWSRFATPVAMRLYDSFSSPSEGYTARRTGTALGVGDSYRYFPGSSLSWSVQTAFEGYVRSAWGQTPYAPWSDASAAMELGLTFDDAAAPLADPEAESGWGFSLLSRIDAPLYPRMSAPSAGFEAGLSGYLRPAAMALRAWGAATASTDLAYGPAGRTYSSGATQSALYPAWAEFAGGASGLWYAGTEASLRLLGAEIQRGAGIFYLNRLSIRAGARAYAVSGEEWSAPVAEAGWSAFARATLVWTPNMGAWAAVHPSSYLEYWYRPERQTGEAAEYGLSYLLVASY